MNLFCTILSTRGHECFAKNKSSISTSPSSYQGRGILLTLFKIHLCEKSRRHRSRNLADTKKNLFFSCFMTSKSLRQKNSPYLKKAFYWMGEKHFCLNLLCIYSGGLLVRNDFQNVIKTQHYLLTMKKRTYNTK